MQLPYTENYSDAVAMAADCLAVTLGAVVWTRPLRKRAASALFVGGIAVTALFAHFRELDAVWLPDFVTLPELWLAIGTTLTTIALFWSGPRGLGVLAALGEVPLIGIGAWLRTSEDELMFAHLAWYGALLGAHALAVAPPRQAGRPPDRLSYPVQDAALFLATVALAVVVMHRVFEGVVINGDEVANTFQADVYAHFRATAPIPPCAEMFENYWVFPYHGHRFSQYTPGWPLFMAAFSRLGLVWLAGPTMLGVVAVGIARLARRLSCDLGATPEGSARIVAAAGPLGAVLGVLGPSLLLNGASRFSHTMVAGCFAWAAESAAALATPGASRRRSLGYGLLLGAATALGVAARPADGGFLGIGVFVYFVRALFQRRVRAAGLVGTCAAFLFFGGVVVVILRLQLGAWFKTGYAVTHLFHPDGKLVLSLPKSYQLKYGIPLATGSYCWWPVAPALGILGLVRALRGRERRVAFMLGLSSLCLVGFYCLVEFGRGVDDGFGPRYILPVIVAQAAGTGAALAPIFARLVACVKSLKPARLRRVGEYGPALLALASVGCGVKALAPLIYPVAYDEYHSSTGPLREARDRRLKHAIVMLPPDEVAAQAVNMAQNAPMSRNPDVLFLILYDANDAVCARENFPGRKWYRATYESLVPY